MIIRESKGDISVRKRDSRAGKFGVVRLGLIVLATVFGLVLAWVTVTAQEGPDFGGSYKTGPEYARPGDVITYTVVAVNAGGSVQGVVLSDTLPGGVEYVPDSCTYDDGNGAWDCDPPPGPMWSENFASGHRITTTFASTVTAGTLQWPLVNQASLAWDGEKMELSFTTTVKQKIPDFEASYKESMPGEAWKDDVITYTVVAVNDGDAVGSSEEPVVLSDTLPSFVPGSCTYDVGFGSGTAQQPCNEPPELWQIDYPFDKGGRITTTFEVTVTEEGTLVNQAHLSWDVFREEMTSTTTVYDTDVPQAEVTAAPEYENTSPITVTWVATPSVGALEEVRLWYRYDYGSWISTTLTSMQQTDAGEFAFERATDGSEDGTYDFAVVALDEHGKSDAEPWGDSGVEETTIYDTTEPTSTATSPDYDNGGAILVDHTANGDVAGLAEVTLWYRYGDGGSWLTSGMTSTEVSGTFAFEPSDDGTYYFQTVAVDNAGNREDGPSGTGDDDTTYDTISPTVVITAPEHISQTTFTVSWSAEDATSGVASYTLEYSSTATSGWESWGGIYTDTTQARFDQAEAGSDYTFRVTAYDQAGNRGFNEATTHVGAFNIYLPLTVRNYAPFCPGYFEGGFGCWPADKGPFPWQGNELGSGLGYSIDDNHALLGNPDRKNGDIPVGYAYIAQTFTVPGDASQLSFDYRVRSWDTVWGTDTENYFDTFEVSINEHPKDITEDQRDARNCHSENYLNPDNETLTPSGSGLVFCGGQPPTDPPSDFNPGWHTVTLDLSAFAGQNVTLYIATWNREYESPWHDDQGYYNTYAYVDNIALE